MAKNVEIESTKNAFKLVVDGNEIEGIQEYSIGEGLDRKKFLTVKISVTQNLSVKAES